jgi:hypothetical protein
MFEVHTGSKPGRPTVLLLLAAGALIATLALAWVQVQRTRVLAEPVSLAGTPLIVRAPQGWVRDPGNPRLFHKLIRKEVWGRERWAAERTLEFHYNDFSAQFMRMFRVAATYTGEPARIGEWEGVQYVVERNSPRIPGQIALRWVTTPAGAQIAVVYTPLAEISHGDLYLLDEVCAAVRLAEAASGAPSPSLAARAGLRLPEAAGWEVLGPDDEGGPGLWVQGVEEQRPVWAIGVFRRSLARWAGPEEWFLYEARQLHLAGAPRAGRRADGTFVGVLRHPAPEREVPPVVSLWAVAASSTRAAVLYVLAAPAHVEQADAAAQQLVGSLEFVSDFPG